MLQSTRCWAEEIHLHLLSRKITSYIMNKSPGRCRYSNLVFVSAGNSLAKFWSGELVCTKVKNVVFCRWSLADRCVYAYMIVSVIMWMGVRWTGRNTNDTSTVIKGLVKIMLTLTSRTDYGLWYHLFPAKCVSGL